MKIYLLKFLLCLLIALHAKNFIDSKTDSINDFKITILHEDEGTIPSEMEITNKFYSIKFRNRQRVIHKLGPIDFCIRDWSLNSNMQDQVNVCIDGSALRPAINSADLIVNNKYKKVVKCSYGTLNQFEQLYTFYANSSIVEIEYVKYLGAWFNTVDIGTPGGIEDRFKASTKVFNGENWIRNLTYHEEIYFNLHHEKEKEIYTETDEEYIDKITYKNHIIMLVFNPENGNGFCRVMPVWNENEGGTRILKMLWDVGFENFPASGDNPMSHYKSFKSCIFVFDNGYDAAINLAKEWVSKLEQNIE